MISSATLTKTLRLSVWGLLAGLAIGCGTPDAQDDDAVEQSADAVKGGKGSGKGPKGGGGGTGGSGGGGVAINYGGGYLESGTYITFVKDNGTGIVTTQNGTIDFSQTPDGTLIVVTPASLFGSEVLRNADGTYFLVP